MFEYPIFFVACEYFQFVLAVLLVAVSSQDVQPGPYPQSGYVPPQVGRPHHGPVTVDAGEFAQVDVPQNGGPVRVGLAVHFHRFFNADMTFDDFILKTQ